MCLASVSAYDLVKTFYHASIILPLVFPAHYNDILGTGLEQTADSIDKLCKI